MSVNWNVVSQIATTMATIVGGASVGSGFFLYRMNRRDEKLNGFRTNLVLGRSTADALNKLLNYELFYEVCKSVADSPCVEQLLKDVHDAYFTRESQLADLKEYLEHNTPKIVVSVSTPLTHRFEEGLNQMKLAASNVEFDYPGIARLLYAVQDILQISFVLQKKLSQDEDAWKAAIIQCYEEDRAKLASFKRFHVQLIELFLGTSQKILRNHHQANIDDCLSFLDLVAHSYLEKTPQQLISISKFEQKQKLVPRKDTQLISDDLREAEKCFCKALSQESLLTLRTYSSQISSRAK